MYQVELSKKVEEWNDFVNTDNAASLYHLAAWDGIFRKTFGHTSFHIVVKHNNSIQGVLPLTLIKSRLFGKYLVSMPFLNYGGVCTSNEQVAKMLIQEAISIARQEKVAYIELRQKRELNLDLPVKKSKVTLILELKKNPDDLWAMLDAKVRNQIRKAQKANLRLEIGSADQVKNFYEVFCVNMRDLGTPVYSMAFFENIAEDLENRVRIFSIFLGDKAVASGYTLGFKDSLEIPWASSIREYNKLCPNTLLYWEIIKYACKSGYKYFDFGRCSPDSGTYNFKKQWGAEPKQLYWYYWLPNGEQMPELNPKNPKYKLLIALWQRLPLCVANLVGPRIAGDIP